MKVQSVVVLKWQFSPPDFFEEPHEIVCDGCKVSIGIGEIEVRIDASIYDADPSLRQRLHDEMNARFLGAQLVSYQAYELLRTKVTHIRPDGLCDYHLEIERGAVTVLGRDLDIRIAIGEDVLVDTKRDRIEKKRHFAALASAHSHDELLMSLLRSRDNARRDPYNELGHLYEIRDALAKRYRSSSKARKALGISSGAWDKFGRLCNDEPHRQGRHRGKHTGELRDATEGELAEAREIASHMIEAYLAHLERASAQPEPSTPAGREPV